MLGNHPMHVVLLATDLATAKDFYHLNLGLELLDGSPYALNFRSGTTQRTLSKSTTGTSDEQTQAAWIVDRRHGCSPGDAGRVTDMGDLRRSRWQGTGQTRCGPQ